MPPSSVPPPDRRTRRWNLVLAGATGVLFLWGALLLGDWLKDREAAYGIAPLPPTATPSRPQPRDPRVEAWLGGGVTWGVSKHHTFGSSPAVLVTALDPRPPEKVFASMLEGGYDASATQALIEKGPSASMGLRTHVTVGRMPSGAFLVRLVPDLEAIQQGRLTTEPGAVTLAFPGRAGWQYVTWAFPKGLDLDAIPDSLRAPADSLEPLDGAADGLLEPVFALGGHGAETVLCRARGRTGTALARVATSLVQRGWVPRFGEEHNARRVVRVLHRDRREIWLSATDATTEGGIVSVILGSL